MNYCLLVCSFVSTLTANALQQSQSFKYKFDNEQELEGMANLLRRDTAGETLFFHVVGNFCLVLSLNILVIVSK